MSTIKHILVVDVESAHTDAKLWDVLEKVGMKDAVTALSEKLDTVIEDGGSLSRGQVTSVSMRLLIDPTLIYLYVETIVMFGSSPSSRHENSRLG